MKNKIPAASFILLSLAIGGLSQSFDKNYVGVAFSPYVKNWENGALPWYNSYSVEDIKIMLRIVAKKFSSISTYGMGVAGYNNNQPWDKADSNCLVARAAANVNKERGYKVISVNQGVYQVSDDLLPREINNAFLAADDANKLFDKTVWGITFTNEYITNQASGEKVLKMIKDNKPKARQRKLSVGTRIHVCGQIYGGELQSVIKKIVKESDYIMCNLYPADNEVNNGIPNAVKAVGNFYLKLKKALRAENPNIEVIIGETGWPDQGRSFNNSPNNIDNLKNFWVQMGQWARQNKVKVQMFEAFDEPWKSNPNSNDPTKGRDGAEGHYGWWKRTNNNDANAYVDKTTGQKP